MKNNLFAIYVLCQRELLLAIKEPSRLIGMIAQPLIFWLIIGSGFMPSFNDTSSDSLSYMQYFYPGILCMLLLFSAIFSTMNLIEDRNSGFLQQILVSPASKYAIVFGKILGISLICLLQASLFLLTIPIAGINLLQIDFLQLYIFMFLASLSLGALGFSLAFISQSASGYHAIMSVLLIPLWLVSGALYPLKQWWLQVAFLFNPIAWIVSSVRGAFFGFESGLINIILLNMGFFIVSIALATLVCKKKI
jgi:ABC-2 type transport system permease protein